MPDSRIHIIDLFAGPGGLGEGFAAFTPRPRYDWRPFHIIASVEKDPAACRTLRLRSFYRRIFCIGDQRILDAYYAYVRGEQESPVSPGCPVALAAWRAAEEEVLEQTLGEPETAALLRALIEQAQITPRTPLLLIGGPPCQAYSSAGRGRNAGTANYRPELDGRHFLYRVYLELLSNHQPVAFVMENVMGMLSSRIAGRRLFPRILRDLTSPATVEGQDGRRVHPRYRIYSLLDGSSFQQDQNPESIQPDRFIIQAEHYGIPQTWHRVILLGLRDDLADDCDGLGRRLDMVCSLSG